jgi:hypothetical protein
MEPTARLSRHPRRASNTNRPPLKSRRTTRGGRRRPALDRRGREESARREERREARRRRPRGAEDVFRRPRPQDRRGRVVNGRRRVAAAHDSCLVLEALFEPGQLAHGVLADGGRRLAEVDHRLVRVAQSKNVARARAARKCESTTRTAARRSASQCTLLVEATSEPCELYSQRVLRASGHTPVRMRGG